MAVSVVCARTEMPDIHESSTTGSSESSSHRPPSIASEHLNNTGCKIKYSERGSRRVYGKLSVYHMEHEIESEAHYTLHSIQNNTRAHTA